MKTNQIKYDNIWMMIYFVQDLPELPVVLFVASWFQSRQSSFQVVNETKDLWKLEGELGPGFES